LTKGWHSVKIKFFKNGAQGKFQFKVKAPGSSSASQGSYLEVSQELCGVCEDNMVGKHTTPKFRLEQQNECASEGESQYTEASPYSLTFDWVTGSDNKLVFSNI
jgi:hypothetical protein